jgi:hypothetical protein
MLRACRICLQRMPATEFLAHKQAHAAVPPRVGHFKKPCPHCHRLIPANEWLDHQANAHRSAASVYRSSGAWKRLRAARLALDGYRCQSCGSTENLECHH